MQSLATLHLRCTVSVKDGFHDFGTENVLRHFKVEPVLTIECGIVDGDAVSIVVLADEDEALGTNTGWGRAVGVGARSGESLTVLIECCLTIILAPRIQFPPAKQPK